MPSRLLAVIRRLLYTYNAAPRGPAHIELGKEHRQNRNGDSTYLRAGMPSLREKAFPLAVLDSRNCLPSPMKPRYTTCASRIVVDHGKPAADFQRVNAGIGDTAGTPDTAGDRRLTPGQ